MRTSHYLLATLKESPADAEIISHQLMLRAGMIRKLASGLYSWLPLGFRVLKKVEAIIREEMNKAGAIEILMPAIQPAELWEETQRWEKFGPQLLKIVDRHERQFCFGPTHEEVITDIARRELKSYKQLPINLYQIQTKFRDEIRPRFGVMRAREFIMKDAYSFHLTSESLEQGYERMYQAYSNIFTRLGLNFRAVHADSGSIGGKKSQEFHVLADSGEDEIFYSDSSDYAANRELAPVVPSKVTRTKPSKDLQKVSTPNIKAIEDVCKFLKIKPNQAVKTLLLKGKEHKAVAVLIRGDHELNEVKAQKHPLIAEPIEFASSDHAGFIGPIGLKDIPIIADQSVMELSDFVCGANEVDTHYINVNWERDLPIPEIADLRNVVVGDPSPDGKGKLQSARGIEVGHIFQLGQTYSKAMNATVLDEHGKAATLYMGCYGIGVSRIVGAAIEQNNDQYGIIWPIAMAPFQIALIPVNMHKSERLTQACEKLYHDLQQAGFDVLWDDRNERLGVMLADMDLIGIPHQIILGDRGLDAGTVEYKSRKTNDKQEIKLSELIQFLKDKNK